MNSVNALFVISTIFVPLLLVSLNYSAIQDYYAYSVPLNSITIWDKDETPDLDKFVAIHEKKDSTCFTTPSMNFFCYAKPRFSDNKDGISVVRSNANGIFGELHAEPIDGNSSYFTMKNMTQINGDTAIITFADRDGYVYERTSKKATIFEFSTVVEKFDTFVTDCHDENSTSVTIVQYLGIETIDDNDYFVTWHTGADLENPLTCDYPEIIQHSLKHDFGI